MTADLPRDDEALERELRDRRFGGPSHYESSPWDFVYGWPDDYLRAHVWPIVSRMLVDDDELVRARAVEFVARWHRGGDVTTPRLIEVARRRPELYAEQKPKNVALRHELYFALCNCGAFHCRREVADLLCDLWLEPADDDTPALAVAEFHPDRLVERARRTSDADEHWLRCAVEGIALWRRDWLQPILQATRHLSRGVRIRLLARVEEFVQRDDERARSVVAGSGVPPPQRPALSSAQCREAIGLDPQFTVEDEIELARAVIDPAKRGAALFVAGGRAEAAGDLSCARALYDEAAKLGSSHAALQLGLMLTSGTGGAPDAENGIAWVKKAAAAGLATAAALLGGALMMNAATASDGVAWLRKAAAANEPSAFWLLGTAYLRGLGVARDPAQARLMMHTAAQGGVVEAQLELAALYASGIGGARDDAAAAAWEMRAAEAGNAAACLRVAERALAQAGGVVRALPWLERAVDGGSVAAAERLAELYRHGRELPRDDERAAAWQSRADELRRG